MKLSNLSKLFNFERTRLKTTATPEGRINHVLYGERPWDYNTYRWTTTGHDLRFEMRQNEYGSFDVAQRIKAGTFKWSWQLYVNNVPKQEAINILITREVAVMRDYGGFKKGVTVGDVQKQVQDGNYGGSHIFGYLKKNPEALNAWAASLKPAAKPASQQPKP